MTDLLELARAVVSRAAPGEDVEAFAVHSRDTSVTVFDGEVESLSSSETRGVGVRVVADGRLGFASTADVSEDGLEFALREARSNAGFATPDPGNVLPRPQPVADVPGIYVDGLRDIDTARKIAFALELERATRAADKRVSSVESSTYGDAETRAAIVSTTGVGHEYARTDAYAYASAIARDDDGAQTGFGLTQGRAFAELDPAAAAREAAMRAARLLGARKPATTRVPVVFDPLVTANFLGVVSGALTAEAVQKGRSLFADRVGETILGAGLSLVDDGRLPGGPAAAPIDDEGVPTRRSALVENGVLARFLHNTETAARDGAAESTGNASRSGYKSTPGVAPTNLFLDGPTRPVAEVLRSAGRALYVQDVSGIHSGVNPVSGEFSVGATGLWLNDGELGEPVREATVSSTIVEMLRAVVTMADDRRFYPFGGALAGATLLLAEMTVAGT